MFDVFYSGKKPGLFAHECEAIDLAHAQSLSRTRYFWWVTYLADLETWDFLWEPVPWEADQRHAWPNQHQPDSGVYLVPKKGFVDTKKEKKMAIEDLENVIGIGKAIATEYYDMGITSVKMLKEKEAFTTD